VSARRRVLIADDHVIMRAGIRVALENADFDVVADVANGPDAVREAVRTTPDLCIVDLYMPGGGVETIREIHRLLPQTVVVVLTVSTSNEDMFDSLAAGAAGFVPKETSADRLPAVLRGVLAGEAALPRRMTATLIEEFRRRRAPRPGAARDTAGSFGKVLTERENDVLDLLANGRATSQIAGELGISDVTVRRHISTIVRKIGVPDRTAAIRRVHDMSET
jgi:DNA-binding NarL/FixJ family response regulator